MTSSSLGLFPGLAGYRAAAADRFSIGSTAEDDNVTGSITVPEVAHDTEEDEFVVGSGQPKMLQHWRLTRSNSSISTFSLSPRKSSQ